MKSSDKPKGEALTADKAAEPTATPAVVAPPSDKLTVPIKAEGIMEALRDVYDPELAISIVDLGLIYEVNVEERSVQVRMTLTSPGCPVGPMLQSMAQGAIKRVYPEAENVRVEIVWSPPWDPYKMASEEAKDMLGIW